MQGHVSTALLLSCSWWLHCGRRGVWGIIVSFEKAGKQRGARQQRHEEEGDADPDGAASGRSNSTAHDGGRCVLWASWPFNAHLLLDSVLKFSFVLSRRRNQQCCSCACAVCAACPSRHMRRAPHCPDLLAVRHFHPSCRPLPVA